jgi:hypothetical protein
MQQQDTTRTGPAITLARPTRASLALNETRGQRRRGPQTEKLTQSHNYESFSFARDHRPGIMLTDVIDLTGDLTDNKECDGCNQRCNARWPHVDSKMYCAACWDGGRCGLSVQCAACSNPSGIRWLDTDSEVYCAACMESQHRHPPPSEDGLTPLGLAELGFMPLATESAADELHTKSHSELKTLCREAGVAVSGTKASLIANLRGNPNPKPRKGKCQMCGKTSSSPLPLKLYCVACWDARGAVKASGPTDHSSAPPVRIVDVREVRS